MLALRLKKVFSVAILPQNIMMVIEVIRSIFIKYYLLLTPASVSASVKCLGLISAFPLKVRPSSACCFSAAILQPHKNSKGQARAPKNASARRKT